MKPFFIALLISLSAFSQVEEVAPPEEIKSIQFKVQSAENQLPIIRLGSRIVLEFDVLNGNEDDFYYEIKHYNFDWTPSSLAESEYLNGFNNQRIKNYENSFNTYQIYSHYTVSIPNDLTRGLKKSGNYMINVYNEDDEMVFSRKFMVYESLANVGVAVKRSRDVSKIKEKQAVDIIINTDQLQLNNPKQNVKVALIQNSNLHTAITTLKPQYILGNELSYKYVKASSFNAGNEYFYFENKDLRGANTGVQFMRLKELYNSYLYRNIKRSNIPYTYYPDINGNYVITALHKDDPSIEADYAWVHFSLELEELPKNKSIHLYGGFNNYAVNESTKMEYYNNENSYELPLLLKQGFYNYKYIVVDEDGTIDEGAISGNFYQTENQYNVVVYYRNFGDRYDRIIGFGNGNSANITN